MLSPSRQVKKAKQRCTLPVSQGSAEFAFALPEPSKDAVGRLHAKQTTGIFGWHLGRWGGSSIVPRFLA